MNKDKNQILCLISNYIIIIICISFYIEKLERFPHIIRLIVSHFILVDDHKENLQKNISLKIEVIPFVNIGT